MGMVNTDDLHLIPGKLLIDTFVNQQEERWMRISEVATFGYRDAFKLPGSDAIEEIRVGMVK